MDETRRPRQDCEEYWIMTGSLVQVNCSPETRWIRSLVAEDGVGCESGRVSKAEGRRRLGNGQAR